MLIQNVTFGSFRVFTNLLKKTALPQGNAVVSMRFSDLVPDQASSRIRSMRRSGSAAPHSN